MVYVSLAKVVEARGGEEDAVRRVEERVRVWGRMVGEVVDAYPEPGSGVAAVVQPCYVSSSRACP
jgi:hypothetical protein